MRNQFTPPELDGPAAAVTAFSNDIDDDIGYEAALPYLMEATSRDSEGAAPWQVSRGLMS